MDKYLSVITNFGCHYTCPYCIVKNNNLQIPKTTIEGLDNLAEEIKKNNCNWVSISGGGDPLWNFERNRFWYYKFAAIITGLDVNIELHTSIINPPSYIALYKRIVYHLHNFEQLPLIYRLNDEIVRVVFVVTEDFTEELIDRIAKYCKESNQIDELSFRQMVDNNYQDTDYCKEYLQAGHQKDWWYIEQCDYNLYYCENKIYTEYRMIGE